MNRPRYLLWDFDETLAYRPGHWTDTVMTVLRRAGLADGVDRETVRPFLNVGLPWFEPEVTRAAGQSADDWWLAAEPILARAFAAAGTVSPPRASELAKEVRYTYLDPAAWVVFDDVEPALTRLTGCGWRHVILSNHVPELPDLVEQLGLAHHFEAVHTSARLGAEKPHPDAFRQVLATLPDGAQVCMIGDNAIADIQGAQAVGIPAILVRKGSRDAKPQGLSLAELVALLEDGEVPGSLLASL
jgi:putative hydrolase of the HAD superfamily